MILRYPPITIGCEYLLKRSVLSLLLNNVFSVKARLDTSGQGGDFLLDSHVHCPNMLIEFPEIMQLNFKLLLLEYERRPVLRHVGAGRQGIQEKAI